MSRGVRGRVWGLVAALVFLHFFLHVALTLGRAAPDLLTVGLLLVAREVSLGKAASVGFLFGLLEDALSIVSFGANTVTLAIVGIGGAFTRDLFVGDSRLFVVSYFWIGAWVRDVLHWVSVGDELRRPFVEQVLVDGGIGGAYAAVVGLAVVTLTGLLGEPA